MRKNDFNQCLSPEKIYNLVADGGIDEVSDSKSVSPFAVNVRLRRQWPRGRRALDQAKCRM